MISVIGLVLCCGSAKHRPRNVQVKAGHLVACLDWLELAISSPLRGWCLQWRNCEKKIVTRFQKHVPVTALKWYTTLDVHARDVERRRDNVALLPSLQCGNDTRLRPCLIKAGIQDLTQKAPHYRTHRTFIKALSTLLISVVLFWHCLMEWNRSYAIELILTAKPYSHRFDSGAGQ